MISTKVRKVQKFIDECRLRGFKSAINKTRAYIKKIQLSKNMQHYIYKDVLFVNGCALEHPARYRVLHQIEQLSFNGYSCDTVFYTDIKEGMENYYNAIIFYRCPHTPEIEGMIKSARKNNKTTFFDVDDLVIGREYTEDIEYLKTMPKEEYDLYMDGVDRMQRTLKLCEHAITTTPALKSELQKFVDGEVFVNRNVASEEMVKYSQEAIKEKEKRKVDNSKIILGYFSGSITHNDDFKMILPVIKKVLKENRNIYLSVVGLLDIPEELLEVQNQIIKKEFVTWRELPKLITEVDINICPLKNTLFNRAKSENKWMEAALVQVPTIASKVGALAEYITHDKTGFLCETIEDWVKGFDKLIDDEQYRKTIAMNAYKEVIRNNVTAYTGIKLGKFIESKLKPNILFVLPSTGVSGGVNVVVRHCAILKKNGYDVTILSMGEEDDDFHVNGDKIAVVSIYNTHIHAGFNKAVATLWSTVSFIDTYPKIKERMYLVQGFETDFTEYGNLNRIYANLTYNSFSNMKYLTISKWCKKWLEESYGQKPRYAPNGIDLNLFTYKERDFKHKIKILIEGKSDDAYKNVDESFNITNKLDKDKFEIHYLSNGGAVKEWYEVDKYYSKVPYEQVAKIYQTCHILLKSSVLESFSYPPLEMMATGGVVVVLPNRGNVEYIVNEKNCLTYKEGDIHSACEAIERICNDKDLRDILIKNGLETAKAREWHQLEQQILEMYR